MFTYFSELPLWKRLVLGLLVEIICVAALSFGMSAYEDYRFNSTHHFLVGGTVHVSPQVTQSQSLLPDSWKVISETMTLNDDGTQSIRMGVTFTPFPCKIQAAIEMGSYNRSRSYNRDALMTLRRIVSSAPNDRSWVLKFQEQGTLYVVHRFNYTFDYTAADISVCDSTAAQELQTQRLVSEWGEGMEIKEITMVIDQ